MGQDVEGNKKSFHCYSSSKRPNKHMLGWIRLWFGVQLGCVPECGELDKVIERLPLNRKLGSSDPPHHGGALAHDSRSHGGARGGGLPAPPSYVLRKAACAQARWQRVAGMAHGLDRAQVLRGGGRERGRAVLGFNLGCCRCCTVAGEEGGGGAPGFRQK